MLKVGTLGFIYLYLIFLLGFVLILPDIYLYFQKIMSYPLGTRVTEVVSHRVGTGSSSLLVESSQWT